MSNNEDLKTVYLKRLDLFDKNMNKIEPELIFKAGKIVILDDNNYDSFCVTRSNIFNKFISEHFDEEKYDTNRRALSNKTIELSDNMEMLQTSIFKFTNFKKINIPSNIKEIAIGAFSYMKNISEIIFSDDCEINFFEDNLFEHSSIKKIDMPSSVRNIGCESFLGCVKLEEISFKTDSKLERIEKNAFYNCTSLKEINFPPKIHRIEYGAFEFCTSLKSVNFPGHVLTLEPRVFSSCRNLENVIVNEGILHIETCAFDDCSNLKTISLPQSLESIGDKAFNGCVHLSLSKIPDSVQEIGEGAFANCFKIKNIKLSENLIKVGPGAFEKCSITELFIPSKLEKIPYDCFKDCHYLSKVEISEGVEKIESNSFSGDINLKSLKLPNSLKEIESFAFYNCPINKLILHEGLEKIGELAFYNCDIKEISLPSTIKSLGLNAFKNEYHDKKIYYKDIDISKCLSAIVYNPEDNFRYSKIMIDSNAGIIRHKDGYKELDVDLFKNICKICHNQDDSTIEKFLSDYKTYGLLDRKCFDYSLEDHKKIDIIENNLIEAFHNIPKFQGRVPGIVDKLAEFIYSSNNKYSADFVASKFNVNFVKNIISNNTPLIPILLISHEYSIDKCEKIMNCGSDIYQRVADQLLKINSDFYTDKTNINIKNTLDWVIEHPTTNVSVLKDTLTHSGYLQLDKSTTVQELKITLQKFSGLAELGNIYKEYGVNVLNCECDIPIEITKYDGKVSRVLDFSSTSDIVLASNLGELTHCCQHMGGAGETAMMHGFLNKNAGFWVIENKDGKVLAQAEIWEENKKTLVFDNIEFADSDDPTEKIEILKNDIANWAEQSNYKNIKLGTGYTDIAFNQMKKAPVPKLKLTAEEVFLMQDDNDAEVEFDDIEDAENFMKTYEYYADDFVYTDVINDNDKQCVYIKCDGKVSDYLKQNFNSDKIETTDARSLEIRNYIDKTINSLDLEDFFDKYSDEVDDEDDWGDEEDDDEDDWGDEEDDDEDDWEDEEDWED